MHFISYYYDSDPTKSTYYKNCATVLKNQLEKYNYKTSFDNIDFKQKGLRSEYIKLNMIKPQYILEKMEQLNDSVVWIDADCVVKKRIEEFENLNEYDMAYAIREHDNITPHAALLYFNNTDRSKKFLNSWKAINDIKVKDDSYNCTEHCTLIDELKSLQEKEKTENTVLLKTIGFVNLARAGSYTQCEHMTDVKVCIGISQLGWEHEFMLQTQNQEIKSKKSSNL